MKPLLCSNSNGAWGGGRQESWAPQHGHQPPIRKYLLRLEHPVPFSTVHFHQISAAIIGLTTADPLTQSSGAGLLYWDFTRTQHCVINNTLLRGFWQSDGGVGPYMYFLVLLSSFVTACFVPDFLKQIVSGKILNSQGGFCKNNWRLCM